jgi:hypothetical protein
MSPDSAGTAVVGVWFCFMGTVTFILAAPWARLAQSMPSVMKRSSPDLEFARTRLAASTLIGLGLSIALLGLFGGSGMAVLRAAVKHWWAGLLMIGAAVWLIGAKESLAKPLTRRRSTLLYRSLGPDQRCWVLSRVIFGVALMLAWFGVVIVVDGVT